MKAKVLVRLSNGKVKCYTKDRLNSPTIAIASIQQLKILICMATPKVQVIGGWLCEDYMESPLYES